MSFWHRIRSKTHAKIHENWRHFFFNLAHTLGRNGAKSKNFWRRVFRGHVRMLFRAKTDSSNGHAYGLQHNATNGTTLKPQKFEISDKKRVLACIAQLLSCDNCKIISTFTRAQKQKRNLA
ncbi:hypothetical protein [Porphyromonas loveana]|uniref:hypothetical protein n=1 Tax=Porphyromonas loveana TaxID=1884669 RepID=UPI0035A1713D